MRPSATAIKGDWNKKRKIRGLSAAPPAKKRLIKEGYLGGDLLQLKMNIPGEL